MACAPVTDGAKMCVATVDGQTLTGIVSESACCSCTIRRC